MGEGDVKVTPRVNSIHWQGPSSQNAVTIGNESTVKVGVIRCRVISLEFGT